jgi:DNA polymerase-3 subunit delta'
MAADAVEAPHPRLVTTLVGHAAAESELIELYRAGRLPHAILFGGPKGIGKATLAYRLARFLLAYPRPELLPATAAPTLAIPADHPATRRVAAASHPNLLTLERTAADSGKLRNVITVEQVRKGVDFFRSTAGEEGWRICIVDSADELKSPEAPNALLKMLEEPPARALFLVVSHAPGRLLPTIRSRCRQIALRPLSVDEVAQAAGAALGGTVDETAIAAAAAVADGSVSRAIGLADEALLSLRARLLALLDRIPDQDPRALHALGDDIDRDADRAFVLFVDAVQDWLTLAMRENLTRPARLARIGEVWDKLQRSARETEVFNLERKPFVFSVFGSIAEAVRAD